MDKKQLETRLKGLKGHVGFYYKSLTNDESYEYHSGDEFEAASLPKLALLLEVLKLAYEGEFSLTDKIEVKDIQKVGGCGALKSFPGDLEVEIETLCRLMITISDNTATNALLRFVGFERIQRDFKEMGLQKTRFERCYFDDAAQERGLSNYVCPAEIGMLLEQIYRRQFCCAEVSAKAEEILLLQQIRHKIPGYIGRSKKIANKTGESGNVTHDGAIVFAEKPFVLVICSEDTNVPETERFMREIALALYEENNI